ncbi:hypothetical protein [Streptomyces sp. URMC 129]|uniref:hypothetical protein n=1 Tax=Streptomyces sp. URMC 129 TaxID=3423407 RepID=UPI003F1D01FE
MSDELLELNATGVTPRPWGRETGDPRLPLRCDWCGHPFAPPKPTGRKPRYCRQSCRQRAYEARETRRAVSAAVTQTLAHLPANRDSSRDRSRGRLDGAESPTLPGLEQPES